MRGKPACRLSGKARLRLIPAHAGKTPPAESWRVALKAHPRACGENESGRVEAEACGGSSPRMRGKRFNRHTPDQLVGLIPAHAGKTFESVNLSDADRAHPRACGENLGRFWRRIISPGSSPRMRGKRGGADAFVCCEGLIPAHAGKTLNDLEF